MITICDFYRVLRHFGFVLVGIAEISAKIGTEFNIYMLYGFVKQEKIHFYGDLLF